MWQEAAQAEYNALLEHGVWDLAECPADRKPIGCGWVFRIKYKADGTVERDKARLVAKGFAQKPHLDYTETFAPVVKFASLRTIIAVAAMEDLELDSMDISSAFLNGDLEEEIYMSQPEGFAVPGKEHLVCRLKKSLYGLKQSPRQWYHKLNETFMQLGFRRIQSDNCIYVWAKDGLRIMIPVFVDDLTLAATGRPLMDSIKAELQCRFKMRDLGPLHYILGIQVIRDRSKCLIYLSQAKHIEDVLEKHNMSNCRPVSTPLDKSVTLSKDDCLDSPDEIAYMSSVPYLSAVGSLMYLSVGMRLDIAYAVGALSRFNSNPGRVHWQQCQRVFRYLQGTRDLMLQYGGKCNVKLDVYSDADYAGDLDSACSTSGYAAFVGTSLVSWASRRQPVVAKSTTEAEYIAANEAGSEGVWFRNFLEELGYPQTSATALYIDNQSTIKVGKNPEHHSRMKHLNTKYHWLREQVEDRVFSLDYLATDRMPVDILTKPLERTLHEKMCHLLGLHRCAVP